MIRRRFVAVSLRCCRSDATPCLPLNLVPHQMGADNGESRAWTAAVLRSSFMVVLL